MFHALAYPEIRGVDLHYVCHAVRDTHSHIFSSLLLGNNSTRAIAIFPKASELLVGSRMLLTQTPISRLSQTSISWIYLPPPMSQFLPTPPVPVRL